MPYYTQEQCKKIYRQFRALDPTAYRLVVHFADEHMEIIRQLPFEQYLDILFTYVNALFETGAYNSHYHQTDELIELVIAHNIYSYREDPDIFTTLLFQKAASAYQLMNYQEAIGILNQLKSMAPSNPLYTTLLTKCLRAIKPKWLRTVRAASILSFLASALVISAEILAVRPIWPSSIQQCMEVRNGLFIVGLILLVSGELVHLTKCRVKAIKGLARGVIEKRST